MRKTKNEEFTQEVPRFLLFFVCKGTGGLPVTNAQYKLLETIAKSLGYKDKVTWETIQNPYIPDGMIQQQQEQAASQQAFNEILLNMQHMILQNNKVDENNEH